MAEFMIVGALIFVGYELYEIANAISDVAEALADFRRLRQ